LNGVRDVVNEHKHLDAVCRSDLDHHCILWLLVDKCIGA
jgi:hypothetical protein